MTRAACTPVSYTHLDVYKRQLRELACEKDLAGKKVVVSAGATQEPMDPVRYLTNHSTCLLYTSCSGDLSAFQTPAG